MKSFTNLPGLLRVLFGFLRGITVALGVCWLLIITVTPFIKDEAYKGLMVTMGDVSVQPVPAAGAAKAASSPLVVKGLRGQLQLDILSRNPALISAARWSTYPAMAACVAFAWLFFGALRTVCANIEQGAVFTDVNLVLIRRIGAMLIGYAVIKSLLAVWAAHVMGAMLSANAALVAMGDGLRLPSSVGTLRFTLAPAFFSPGGGLLAGCIVLVIAEAFRQGLAIKSENDLTV